MYVCELWLAGIVNFLAAWCHKYIVSCLPISNVRHSCSPSTAWWISVLVYGLWNARFPLWLNASHFNFPLWANSNFDKENVHLTVQHCPIHPLKVNRIHVAEHVSEFLNSTRISSCRIRSLVETYKRFGGSNWLCFHHKDGGTYHLSLHSRKRMDDKFLSVYMVSQPDDCSVYRHFYENLKYHSKTKNDTSISSSVHKIAVCPKTFKYLK